MPADLQKDTEALPVPEKPGLYSATIPEAWSWHLPSGGVLMTAGLRAIEREIGDSGFRPVSATAIFCDPVPAGPLSIEVTLLRRGSAAIQARARLQSETSSSVDLEVSATFLRQRPGIDVIDAARPDVPLPSELPPFAEPPRIEGKPRFPFLENFEARLALGSLWWEPGWSPGPARYARWIRYLVPQKTPDGMLDPLALPPIADLMPPALRQKLGPDAPQFMAPSLDLTVHFLDPTPSEWLLVSVYARRARAGYATAEVEIWGDDGKLAAYGTQTMILRRPSRRQ